MATVGWIDAEEFLLHDCGAGHPERPRRLVAVREGMAKRGVESRVIKEKPSPVDRALLHSVHAPEYVAAVERLCLSGGGRIDADTTVVPESWEAALLAAGAVADATHRVKEGIWRRAFCSVRPPGHHARPRGGMGFCLFDNIAVGAQAALNSDGIERVAIIDWDVHHGNGTQDIFWNRADVLFASMHQYPFYPGTGAADEIGEGEGKDLTINCPIAAGDGDEAIGSAWRERIMPALCDFGPQMIFISAGFDADRRDPLAHLEVTPKGFSTLSEAIVRWADEHCDGRVVSVLEGGYALAALAENVPLHVQSML